MVVCNDERPTGHEGKFTHTRIKFVFITFLHKKLLKKFRLMAVTCHSQFTCMGALCRDLLNVPGTVYQEQVPVKIV